MLQFENKASNSPILVIYSVCTRWTTRNLMYETIFSVKSYAWMEGDGELSGVLILCSFGCFAWCSPNILGGSHRTAWPSRHKAARFKNRDVRQDLQKAFVSLRHISQRGCKPSPKRQKLPTWDTWQSKHKNNLPLKLLLDFCPDWCRPKLQEDKLEVFLWYFLLSLDHCKMCALFQCSTSYLYPHTCSTA